MGNNLTSEIYLNF